MISHMRLTAAQGTVEALKRIMAYLVGTLKKRLTAVRNGATEWTMYSDSDHAGESCEWKSKCDGSYVCV